MFGQHIAKKTAKNILLTNMEILMKSWPVRELKYHKVGQHKPYWPVSITHLKVGHQTAK